MMRSPFLAIEVLNKAASLSGYTVGDIVSPWRAHEVSWVRTACIFVMREQGLSLPKIADAVNRDHSTIMYGLRRARAFLADPGFKEFVEALR